MNDKEKLSLIYANPQEGLRIVIDEYGGLLTAVASKILKNPQDAEECVADAFIGIWKTAGRLENLGSLKGYLLCSVRNNAINRYNQLKRQNISATNVELIADEDMELMLTDRELIDELQKQILRMSYPDGDIFIRKYFLFEKVSDIAVSLGMTELQVKGKLYRGRKRLRKIFGEENANNEEIVFETAGQYEHCLQN